MATLQALLAEEERLLADVRRAVLRAQRQLASPLAEAERTALIDDLLAIRHRLLAAMAIVKAGIHRNSTARAAVSAYRRVGALHR